MKSLMLLLDNVLQDCSTYCDTTTTRDFLQISRRVEHEGLSFLTISLGNYATDFESGLEHGYIDASSFAGFAKNGTIPKLFSGMFRQVFDIDGRLLDEPSVAAVFCIRQVCRMWKKMLLPCTEERNRAAVDGYIKLEESLSMLGPDKIPSQLYADFGRVSDLIWTQVLSKASLEVSARTHVPKHGSGAVASKMLPNQKYQWSVWHQRLEDYFPSDSFCYHNSGAFMDESSKIDFLSPEQEQPVRIVFVPKTLKSPRVIGIEPACMQYTQQSLMTIMVDSIESSRLTKGHINFRDQSINAQLALSSSKDRSLATLDLSEASDRVLSHLVERMLEKLPDLKGAIYSCRSTNATLPNGLTLPLSKFASMGSALCFPIESMVFFTILVLSEIQRLSLPLTPASVKFVRRRLYVYGDDLIIPVDAVSTVTTNLGLFGLKVNSNKSFSKGNFRESCGMDAYMGVPVTTVYIRRKLPSGRRDVRGIVSAAALSNQLYRAGFFSSAAYIEKFLHSKGVKLPYVSDTSSCVGYVRDVTLTRHRWNGKLHRSEVKGFVVVPKSQTDVIDGNQALMKWFLKGLNPDKDNYRRTVGSGLLTVKTQWCAV